MTKLTIEELNRLENMTPAEMIDDPEFMQAVYGKMAALCRRVIEAQAKGGKMVEKDATMRAVLAIRPFMDHAPQFQVIDIVFAAAPDMLADGETHWFVPQPPKLGGE